MIGTVFRMGWDGAGMAGRRLKNKNPTHGIMGNKENSAACW